MLAPMSTDPQQTEQQRIEAAIVALLAQRELLGDAVVDIAIAPMRARLAALCPASPEAPAQTLRQVTILFLDVVGSTALSRQLDPEDIHALMDGVLSRCTTVVDSHSGKVLQYAGDSLLAVFGYDLAREDDAERAVRAGLALLEEGRRQGESVKRSHGYDGFDVRVGVHTGNVLLGGGVDSEGSIRGIAVNIAARMEQTAPAGALRISRDTYHQVRGLFDVEPQPPLEVKGIDELIVSYLVQRVRPRAFRVPGRGLDSVAGEGVAAEVGMIGRDAEIGEVMRVLGDAQALRSLRMITVVADAGVGKSRLLLEVERRLERHPGTVRLLHGRAQRHGLNLPHGVVRDMLAWHCDILDSDAPETACAKLTAAFGAPFGNRAEEQSALVGHLIGLDFSSDPHVAGIVQDGRQIRARAFHAIAQFLRLQCEVSEDLVVLLLDDLHWADDGSLDLIEYLATACRDLPLVLGCFARPALFERRATWGKAAAHATRIELKPLAVDTSGQLVDALLARMADPPPELRALILQNAEGNPFHIEELLGMLIDDGVIVPTLDGWQVDRGRLNEAKVPPTLTAVLQARLDALPMREKLALQQDSVIGHVFWDGALQEIAPESVDALDPLARREFISLRDVSAFAGVREFAFKHHLLHQVTYDTVLKGPKRDLHRRTADWLVKITGERISEHLGLIADHYERARDVVNAARYLGRASEAAYGAAAYGAALDYVNRALALTPERDLRARFDLLSIRTNVCNATGRRTEQAEDIAIQAQCAEALDDDRCRAKVARWQSLVAVVTGNYSAALEAADRAQALAALVDDPVTALRASLDKGQALIYMGDPAAAKACLESSLPLARASGRGDLECTAMSRLNYIAQGRGDYVAARAYLEQSLAVARGSGNRRFEGGLMANLGVLETQVGHYERARGLLEAGLRVSRAIGDRGSEPYALMGIAAVDHLQGNARAALSGAIEARDLARAVGDRGCEAECTLLAGECHAELGHVEEATACFDDHDGWARQASPVRMPPPPIAARAELALKQGRFDEARAIVAQLVSRLAATGSLDDKEDLKRYFVCHRVLAATGELDAAVFLSRAHAMLSSRADRLQNDDRAAYLGNIRLHREIVAAWLANGAIATRPASEA